MVSVAAVAVLAVLDPKRNRALRGRPAVIGLRRGLVLLFLIPGIVLAVQGRAGTLLVWVGVVSVAGWIAAWLVNAQRAPADDS